LRFLVSAVTLILLLTFDGGEPYERRKMFPNMAQCESGKTRFEKLTLRVNAEGTSAQRGRFRLISATCVPPLRIAPVR